LEKGYLFYDGDISDKFIKNIQDEMFLDIQQEKIEILDMLNDLALKEINV